MIRKPKILLVDIETSPNLGYTWGVYEQNVIHITKEWTILSFAAKWLDNQTVYVYGQNTLPEGVMLQKLHALLEEADVVVAHNGDRFDVRKINARFIKLGFKPPKPYKTIDTLKAARRYFAFNTNRLDDLGKYLNVGEKIKHSGFELWLGCLNGNPQSWKEMLTYNKQDVLLLEKVYLKLRPWITNHPNLNNYSDNPLAACPKCHSYKVQSRGTVKIGDLIRRRYQCQTCSGWFKVATDKERPVLNL